jgi:HEAT repeat protein
MLAHRRVQLFDRDLQMNQLAAAVICTALLALAGCASHDETPMLAGGREIEFWLTALHDPDPKVRRQAVLTLGNVGDAHPEVEDGLAEALRDPDSQVRRDAVFAVVKLQQPCADIVNQLDAIRQEDSEPGIRDAATRALAKIRSSD